MTIEVIFLLWVCSELDEFDQEVLRSVLEFDEFYTEIEAENDSEKGDFETEDSE